tara:strand:- start:3852 stop:5057 length:1206 start_codon:yes stop_codon:yes gene_type:complete
MKSLHPSSVLFTLFLASAVALGPLSTDMYLPTFPSLAEFFSASAAEVQLTLSVFSFGIGVCQLIYGPLTDRFGRRPVIILGLSIFIIASAGCVVADTIEQLILFRFLQALGVCAGLVVPRAMVRDLFAREQAATQLSRMGTIMGLAPAVAPVLGGYVAALYGWQAVFIVPALVAMIIVLVTMLFVDESHQNLNRNALHPGHIIRNYAGLLRSREFLGYSLTGGFAFGALFSFISGSPLVLINVYGVAPEVFGYYFAAMVLGYMTGTLLGPYFTKRKGLNPSIGIGTLIIAAGGLLMTLTAWSGVGTEFSVVIPMVLAAIGIGMVLPQTQAGAMAPFPTMAGSASALSGFIMLGFSALLGYIVAAFYDGTQYSLVYAIALTGCLSAIVFRLLIRKGRHDEAA